MYSDPVPPEGADSLIALRDALRAFARDRDWEQFHSPKNLALSLCVEAGELLEHFQWIKEDDSYRLSPQTLEEVRLELADVLLYLVRLADRLDVDLKRAAVDKLAINARKYPAEKARGTNRKYDRL